MVVIRRDTPILGSPTPEGNHGSPEKRVRCVYQSVSGVVPTLDIPPVP